MNKPENYKEVTIDGTLVRYIEYPGIMFSRYKVSVLVGNEHIISNVICPPSSLMEELEELVFIQNMRRRNRK